MRREGIVYHAILPAVLGENLTVGMIGGIWPRAEGEAMRRRTGAGGHPIKTRRRKTATLKRRNAPKAALGRSSPTAVKETKVARLTRELQEALAQQTATSDVLW